MTTSANPYPANPAPPAPELSQLQHQQYQQVKSLQEQLVRAPIEPTPPPTNPNQLSHIRALQHQLSPDAPPPVQILDVGAEQSAQAPPQRQHATPYTEYPRYDSKPPIQHQPIYPMQPIHPAQHLQPMQPMQGMPLHNGIPPEQQPSQSPLDLLSEEKEDLNAHHPGKIQWDERIDYDSKANGSRHASQRIYFSHVPPIINALPRKPELKQLVLKGRDFYVNNRDPRFYNPIAESGWNGRQNFGNKIKTLWGQDAQGNIVQLPPLEQQQQGQGQSIIQSQFPVLIQSEQERVDSKLLIPFLHHWPPPYRYDFLKKHSRAPLSPFLASMHGYEVPQELYMSARQRKEAARQEEYYRHQAAQEGGYAYAAPSGANSSQQPKANLSDPIERARVRANIHTTYWRTVPPEGVDPSMREREIGGLPGSGRKPQWDSRHHLLPKPPRVGQTKPKRVVNKKANLRAQQQQQAQTQGQYYEQPYGYAQHYPPTLPPMFAVPQHPQYTHYPPQQYEQQQDEHGHGQEQGQVEQSGYEEQRQDHDQQQVQGQYDEEEKEPEPAQQDEEEEQEKEQGPTESDEL